MKLDENEMNETIDFRAGKYGCLRWVAKIVDVSKSFPLLFPLSKLRSR